jgi:hypothetical protein
MTKDEALKLALEALENELAVDMSNYAEIGEAAEQMYDAITAIKEALAQPAQEPVILADKALKRIFLEVNRLAMTTYTAEGNQMICIEPSLYKQLRKAIEALAQPEQERNFCPRCGKRTADIHTCTPPQEKNV